MRGKESVEGKVVDRGGQGEGANVTTDRYRVRSCSLERVRGIKWSYSCSILTYGSVHLCVGRYVLISHPSEWSEQLRLKFLEGLDAFLELLKCMQVTKTCLSEPVCLNLSFSLSEHIYFLSLNMSV